MGEPPSKQQVREAFAEVLRKTRAEVGISQAELAERSGLTRTYVSFLERGERQPTLHTLVHIGRALGTDASRMAEGALALLPDGTE